MNKATNGRGLVKSLFFGDIHEDMVFPYPVLDSESQARLAAILGSLRALAQKEID